MDPTSPLSSDPDEPADVISAVPSAASGAAAARPPRAERRLRRKLRDNEELVAWGRAWLSRDGKLHGLLAARTLDFIVLTADNLLVFSTGFFSRRPRRRVYQMPLDRLFAEERKASRGRRLAIWTKGRRPLLLEMRTNPRNEDVADRILRRVAESEAQMKLQLQAPADEE
jgi:hypothetical protein